MITIAYPLEAEGLEPCVFCWRPTGFWTDLPDREPKDQVACCAACGEAREPEEVPSKDEWFRRAFTRVTYKIEWKVTF